MKNIVKTFFIKHRLTYIILLAYLILPIILFWKLFFLPFEDRLYIQGDFTQYFSAFYYLKERLLQGEFPLWNHHMYQGLPQIARLDMAMLYPINLIWVFFSIIFNLSDYSLYIWYELQPLVHLSIAGFGTFLLCSYLGISKKASFISGLIFMFSTILQSMVNTVAIINTLTWLPFILLFFSKSLENRKSIIDKNLIYAALLMGLSHLAGYFQHSFLYNGMYLFAFFLYNFFIDENRERTYWVRKVVSFGILFAVGGLIFAAQLLPTLQLSALSDRKSISYATASITGAAHPVDLMNFFIPNFFLYPINGDLVSLRYPYVYFGLLPSLLAVIATFHINHKYKYFFVITFIIFIIASLGSYTSVYEYLYLFIPGMDKFRNVHKLIYPAALSLSILAGIGLDTILSQKDKNALLEKTKWYFLPLLVIPFVLLNKQFLIIEYYEIFLKSLGLSDGPAKELVISAVFIFCILYAISFIALKFAITHKNYFVYALVVLVIFLDLSNAGRLIHANNIRTNPAYYFFSKNDVRFMEPIMQDNDIFRVFLKESPTSAQYTPELFDIYSVSGYSSFALDNVTGTNSYWPKVWGRIKTDSLSEILTKMGVKYMVSSTNDITDPNMKLIKTDTISEENYKYYFKYGSDYAGWVNQSPGDSVYVYENKLFKGFVETPASYSITKFKPEKIEINMTAFKDTKAIVKIPKYPGWRATINDMDTPINEAESGYISIDIPTGASTVVLRFVPTLFYIGLGISVVTITLCVLFVIQRKCEYV